MVRRLPIRRAVSVLTLALLSGCIASGTPSGSAPGSLSPSSGERPSALSFCDPIAIQELRAPDGSVVVLQGWWAHAGEPDFPTDVIHVAVRQAGDCIWLVETLAWGEDPGAILAAWEFHGRVHPDFTVVGEFSDVFGSYPGDPWTYGPFAFRINVAGTSVELIEDREPEDPAPGCGGLPGTCPDPLHYVRLRPF